MKLTTRSNMSKTYYWGKYGLLHICSFYSDLTVALLVYYIFVSDCFETDTSLHVWSVPYLDKNPFHSSTLFSGVGGLEGWVDWWMGGKFSLE